MISNTARTHIPDVILKEPPATEGSRYPRCAQADTVFNLGQDRLAHAKKFADQLSESRLREMTKSYRKRWTPAARARKRQIIQSVKPWLRSTGPKCGRKRGPFPAIAMALGYHQRYLRKMRLLLRLRRLGAQSPELSALELDCERMGHHATFLLALSLVTERNNE